MMKLGSCCQFIILCSKTIVEKKRITENLLTHNQWGDIHKLSIIIHCLCCLTKKKREKKKRSSTEKKQKLSQQMVCLRIRSYTKKKDIFFLF